MKIITILIILLIYIFINGCATPPPVESPPPQKNPLAFNNNETIQQYLERMMNAFSGNKQPVAEKSAVLYKLPGALNKNIITKTLYQNILDLCHSNYQGWVLTMERVRRDIINNDILINKFGGNELEVLAASKSGASLNIAPSYIQDFVLYNLTREVEKNCGSQEINVLG